MPPNHKPSPATLACFGLHLSLCRVWRRRGSHAGRITTATAPRQPLYSQPGSLAPAAQRFSRTHHHPTPAGRPPVRPWPWRPPASAGQARRGESRFILRCDISASPSPSAYPLRLSRCSLVRPLPSPHVAPRRSLLCSDLPFHLS